MGSSNGISTQEPKHLFYFFEAQKIFLLYIIHTIYIYAFLAVKTIKMSMKKNKSQLLTKRRK